MGQQGSRQAGEFHPRHGNNIVAHRIRDFDQALVYSSKPISHGEVFQVRLLEKEGSWSGSLVRVGEGQSSCGGERPSSNFHDLAELFQ